MLMRPELQIKSILKAMTDVVLPALDPNNPLAQEQARLCMGMLSLMAVQLPLQYRYDCDELRRLIELSRHVQGLDGMSDLAPKALADMDSLAGLAEDVLSRARAEPDEVLQAVRSLRAVAGQVVQEAFANDEAGERSGALQSAVMRTSQEQLLRERSWVLTQGWEADPKGVPAIDTLIAPLRARGS